MVYGALQEAVRSLARNRCEYCHFPEEFAELPFQIDHIIAKQHGGKTNPTNLALACPYCNRFKGPNLSSIDPLFDAHAPLFHPRKNRWSAHFAWNGPVLVGKTSMGRATINALKLNAPEAIEIRRVLMELGEFDPQERAD